ncbi:MAG: phosphotransferase, partial [Planctomycetales bacterium]|nr:phosphotransferase [Planctomycetales bacterium]
VRDKLRWEMRLQQEQRHLTDAARFYRNDHEVQIPRLSEHCSPRVTAMERIYGAKVTDYVACAAERQRIARVVSRTLLASPIYAKQSQAMFHGDPHAGNLLYTCDGKLALLDWSLVSYLGESERIAMTQIVLAAITLDAQSIVSLLHTLDSTSRASRQDLQTVVDKWLRPIHRGQLPGLLWLVGLMDDVTQATRLRMGPDMMMFRKSLHTLTGVVRDLGGTDADIEATLLREFVLRFASELPTRWLAYPTSRAFATRLSNFDLTTTALRWPLATAQRLCGGEG